MKRRFYLLWVLSCIFHAMLKTKGGLFLFICNLKQVIITITLIITNTIIVNIIVVVLVVMTGNFIFNAQIIIIVFLTTGLPLKYESHVFHKQTDKQQN